MLFDVKSSGFLQLFSFNTLFYVTDNILDDKPDAKGPADKDEQPTDEIPKRMKKADNMMQSKGKVGPFILLT